VIRDGQATPYGGTFFSFGNPAISGSNLAFLGNYSGGIGTQGIFAYNGGVTGVAGGGQATPNGGTFTGFGSNVSISGNNITFLGNYGGGAGSQAIFLNNGTDTLSVARDGQATPNRGTFTGFSGISSISGDTVAFSANYSGGTGSQGIFAFSSTTGTLSSVVRQGDQLFGGTVQSVQMSSSGLDGDRVAFRYALTDGTNGIAVAAVAVPEVGTGVLAVPALLALIGIYARRTRRTTT
jgi:hypothetical protein